MKIGPGRAKHIAPLVRAAVQAQIDCWRFQGEIEQQIGVYFRNMEQAIQDWAAAGDPKTITEQDVQALIGGLDIEVMQRRTKRKQQDDSISS